MRLGNRYEAKVDGCGKREVRFIVGQEVACGQFHGSEKSAPRKAELAVTTQGTIIARKVVYGKRKKEQYRKFSSLKTASKWFNKRRPEEAQVLAALAASPDISVTPIVEKPLI